jgi:hypothetical protein
MDRRTFPAAHRRRTAVDPPLRRFLFINFGHPSPGIKRKPNALPSMSNRGQLRAYTVLMWSHQVDLRCRFVQCAFGLRSYAEKTPLH